MKRVILLCGANGSGKTTIANKIENLYKKDYNVLNIALSDFLYKEISLFLNIPIKDLHVLKRENILYNEHGVKGQKGECCLTIREWLEYYSSLNKTLYGNNYYVNKVLNNVKKQDIIIISDVRFLHEYEKITKSLENTVMIFIDSDYDVKYDVDKLRTKSDYILSKNQNVNKDLIDKLIGLTC